MLFVGVSFWTMSVIVDCCIWAWALKSQTSAVGTRAVASWTVSDICMCRHAGAHGVCPTCPASCCRASALTGRHQQLWACNSRHLSPSALVRQSARTGLCLCRTVQSLWGGAAWMFWQSWLQKLGSRLCQLDRPDPHACCCQSTCMTVATKQPQSVRSALV